VSPNSKQLKNEIQKQARNKLLSFYSGLAQYQQIPVEKWQPDAKNIWQEGTTKIWDYGGKGRAVLIIAPLINRANILDLQDNSFVQFLKSCGLRPLLVDWYEPGEVESNFSSDDYVARLNRFCQSYSKEIMLVGYCMGGLIALKLAKLFTPTVLILLATPWNFASPDVKRINIARNVMESSIEIHDFVPPEIINSLFLIADPWRVYNKYSAFKKHYAEIEVWSNSGVKMSVPLAKEAILDWSIDNKTGKGEWLDVSNINSKTFLACPTNDRIVPIGCSVPLAGLLKNAELYKFNCGHVGLIISADFRKKLADWIRDLT
jgi:polyhydroxyalkanoate synthase